MLPSQVYTNIPLCSECKNEPILVILFGNIWNDHHKREEICRVTDARSSVLSRSNNVWPIYVLLSDVADDVFGNSGTVTDIYDIATAARQCGWESLMLVDELSWRQHSRLITNREDPVLSATIINSVCASSESVLSPKSTFYMRRLPFDTAMEECYLAEPQKPKDWSQPAQRAENHSFQPHLRTGFYLYCPWEPIFSQYNVSELHEQALGARPSLPQELKNEIMGYLRPTDPVCLQDLIDTSGTLDLPPQLIQPLLPLSDQESSAIYEAIKGELPEYSFKMGCWKQTRFSNRRDLSRILRHFSGRVKSLVFVLNRPSDETGLQLAWYDPSSEEKVGFGVLRKFPLGSLKDLYRGSIPPVVHQWRTAQWDKENEVHINPLWSFPPSLPQWYKTLPLVEVSQTYDGGSSQARTIPDSKYLAFYLTKSLSDTQQRAIQAVIEADNISGVEFEYIPWADDTDGGPEDMLRILKMVEYAADNGYHMQESYVLVFIDRQSATDHKVIGCTWQFVQNHGQSGIVYGRLGWQLDSFIVNVSQANMGIEEWVEELEFFRDPDYSGPLESDDENPDE